MSIQDEIMRINAWDLKDESYGYGRKESSESKAINITKGVNVESLVDNKVSK